jgi:lactate dehydrogenase-like 2-hydroxyacid dehydrogenase
MHTAGWNKGAKVFGKKVAVIGIGSVGSLLQLPLQTAVAREIADIHVSPRFRLFQQYSQVRPSALLQSNN